MENFDMDGHPKIRLLNTIVMAVISIASIREWVSIIAGVMAIISGYFAIRHYIAQYKISKQILKSGNNKQAKQKGL